jgi:eukaryotic-like serine/threonine-protein kinase
MVRRVPDHAEAGDAMASPPDRSRPDSRATSAELVGGDVVYGDKVLGDKIVHTYYQTLPTPPPPDRNRRTMLDKVQLIWITGLLEAAQHAEGRIGVHLQTRPDLVESALDDQYQELRQAARALPPDTAGALLIVGGPGSGKTTLLLELARDLLARARDDSYHPIPVVLNLSSWAVQQRPLAEWLVDELNTKYDVPRRVAQQWVANDALLLLLDGLDEVRAEQRAACVAAINAYRDAHGLVPLAVCCRSADYAALPRRLELQTAVEVQPLTAEQIDAYLAHYGPTVAPLRALLPQDHGLLELAQMPLMLTIMARTYYGAPALEANSNVPTEARRQAILDQYLQGMFTRRAVDTRYGQRATLHWLRWLAQTLQQQGQAVFLIEQLQPELLAPPARRLYDWGMRLVAGLCVGLAFGALALYLFWARYGPLAGSAYGLLFGFVLALAFALAWERAGRPTIHLAGGLAWGPTEALVAGVGRGLLGGSWLSALATGLPTAIILGLAAGLVRSGSIDVAETLNWSPARAWRRGLLGGLVVGVVGGLSFAYTLRDEPLAAALRGGLGGLGIAIVTGVALGLSRGRLTARSAPNEGIWRSLRNAVWWGGTLSLGVVLAVAPASYVGFALATGDWREGRDAAIFYGLNYGLSVLLVAGVVFGGFACMQHALLRLLLARGGQAPWNYARFLDYCAERILVRKVGNGYLFIHRLLQEHVARLANDDIARLDVTQ